MKNKIFTVISYFNILYFLEIINIIMVLLITYGKPLSIGIGFVLSVLLSLHIIRFYFNRGCSRKIQLFLMDIHFAYSFPFFIYILIDSINITMLDGFFMTIRFIILCAETIFIYLLTGEKLIEQGLRNPQA